MSYPPYGQNPYGQNPYGQPQSQPSAPWGQPAQGAGSRPPQQPGWGQPVPQPGGWGAPPQNPAWGAQPAQNPWSNQPSGNQPIGENAGHSQGSAAPAPGQLGPAQPVPPTPVPEPETRTATLVTREIPVTTTESVAGRQVVETLGEAVGVITRPRDMRHAPDVSVTLTQSRQDAVSAMVEMAVAAGADAVVGLRFDGGKVSDGTSEVAAYGTAVKLDRPAAPAHTGGADEQDLKDTHPSGDQGPAPLAEPAPDHQQSQLQGEPLLQGDRGQKGSLGETDGTEETEQNPFVSF